MDNIISKMKYELGDLKYQLMVSKEKNNQIHENIENMPLGTHWDPQEVQFEFQRIQGGSMGPPGGPNGNSRNPEGTQWTHDWMHECIDA